jgi:hypothetical protein
LADLSANDTFTESPTGKSVELDMGRVEHGAHAHAGSVAVVYAEVDSWPGDRPVPSLDSLGESVRPCLKMPCGLPRPKRGAFLLPCTDGAVSQFMPDFGGMTTEALKPVQVSAKGTDRQKLEREFRRGISVWGGGATLKESCVSAPVERSEGSKAKNG